MKCSNCQRGVVQGAICTVCDGTTFVTAPQTEMIFKQVKETVAKKAKKVVSKNKR